MSTYVVNVDDPTRPLDNQGATQGAEEIRAIKAKIFGFAVENSSSASVRQAIQSASLDANGYNNALTVGAGLRPGLLATTEPYQLSYASGFNTGKAINQEESIIADVADILAADLPTSNINFLYRTFAAAFKSTLIPPQYGYAFDRTKQALLNFEGTDTSVGMIDDFGNTWTASGNAQIDTAQFKFGASSLLLDGTGDFVRSANFTNFPNGSWEISMWPRLNALPGVGLDAFLFDAIIAAGFGIRLFLRNTAGTTKLVIVASSNGTSNDIAAGNLGTNTVWTLNQWNKIRLVFDALGGSYKIYLSLNGAIETIDLTIASALRICAFTGITIGADFVGGSAFNGWIDAFRFLPCATKTGVETPAVVAPTVTDYIINFFQIPAMKMFEVTTASVIAGNNPTLTAANNLFLGEADTSGVAVTAIRNYAIRGEYISPTVTLSNGPVSLNHNIGIGLVFAESWIINKTSEAAYTPGMRIKPYSASGTVVNTDGNVINGRNIIEVVPGSSGWVIMNKTTGIVVNATIANWDRLTTVRRVF